MKQAIENVLYFESHVADPFHILNYKGIRILWVWVPPEPTVTFSESSFQKLIWLIIPRLVHLFSFWSSTFKSNRSYQNVQQRWQVVDRISIKLWEIARREKSEIALDTIGLLTRLLRHLEANRACQFRFLVLPLTSGRSPTSIPLGYELWCNISADIFPHISYSQMLCALL